MSGIDVALMRGGTSRGVVVRLEDVAPAGPVRDQQACALIGRNLVDGLGGGSPITNKVVLVGPAGSGQADLDYIVGNVSSDGATVDWSGTCGNMTSAVIPYAICSNMVHRARGLGPYTLRNLATGGLVEIEVQSDGAGWPADGTEVVLTTAFLDPGGAVLGDVMPTGGPRDVVAVDGESFAFTLVDVTHPYLLLSYEQVVGSRDIAEASTEERIEQIRGSVCVSLGLCGTPEDAASVSPAVPRVVLLHENAPPGVDLQVTAVSMGRAIGSVPVTAALSIAAARGISGTIVADAIRGGGTHTIVGAGTGSLAVEALVDDNGWVQRTTVERTARMLMQGRGWL